MDSTKLEIEKLKKEAEKKEQEAKRLTDLSALYPGLKKHVGRWDRVAYCTAEVNEKVTDYDWRHNCGCCQDSPIEVWPYLDTEFGRVYSDPPSFFVGERGGYPNKGWEEQLRSKKIPEAIIDRVRHLMRNENEPDDRWWKPSDEY